MIEFLILVILVLVLGVSFGSFFGVLNDRLKSDGTFAPGSLLGRSRCDKCQRFLNALDLVPLVS